MNDRKKLVLRMRGVEWEFQYFEVSLLPRAARRKTDRYMISNKRTGRTLGLVEWHSAWRQFCFVPSFETIWSSGCLDDINKVLRMVKELK